MPMPAIMKKSNASGAIRFDDFLGKTKEEIKAINAQSPRSKVDPT